MASLENTKIKDTYEALIKISDNGEAGTTEKQLSDGAGNNLGVSVDTNGNVTANGRVAFGSIKDTGENIEVTKFVDQADGISNNDNDTSIPTSAAVKDYVDTKITAEDLDFTGDSGSGSVDLDSQTLDIRGTGIVSTSASGQDITINAPGTNLSNTKTNSDVTIASSTGTNTTISAASTTEAGVMVASDKTKLNHISVTQAVDLDSMETSIATNGANISTNATNIGNNTSSISTNTANISNNASAISTNTSNISTNTSNISTNAANISSNDGDIANLQQDVNDIETKTDFISVTQAVNLDTMESNIATNNAKNSYPTADATKVGFISVTQAVDLDAMESDISTNAGNISTNTTNISTNTGDISTNAANISTNTSNISSNTTALGQKLPVNNPTATGQNITINATGSSCGIKMAQGTMGSNTWTFTNSGAYKYINNSSYSTTTPQFTIASDRITYGTTGAYGFGGSGFQIGGSTSVNRLDEYETGTYNPDLLILAMGGVSVTLNASHSNVLAWTNNSTYVKIGDVVHVNVDLTFRTSSWYTSTFYTMALDNLPFTPVHIYSATGGYYTNGVNTASGASSYATYRLQGFSYGGTATHVIGFYKAVANGSWGSSNHYANHFNATGLSYGQQIKGHFSYTTS